MAAHCFMHHLAEECQCIMGWSILYMNWVYMCPSKNIIYSSLKSSHQARRDWFGGLSCGIHQLWTWNHKTWTNLVSEIETHSLYNISLLISNIHFLIWLDSIRRPRHVYKHDETDRNARKEPKRVKAFQIPTHSFESTFSKSECFGDRSAVCDIVTGRGNEIWMGV